MTVQSYTFLNEDRDNARSYYRGEADARLYCLQDDSTRRTRLVVFYLCSRDGEPAFSIDMPTDAEFDRVVDPSLERAND